MIREIFVFLLKPIAWQLKREAARGEADSMYALGAIGNYFELDATKSHEWYEKAAENGHARAMCKLAICYRYGTGGVQQNLAKARELLEKGVALIEEEQLKKAQPHSKGKATIAGFMYELGRFHHDGIGSAQNFAKAREWYDKAASIRNKRTSGFSRCVSAICSLVTPKRTEDEVTVLSREMGRSGFNVALSASSQALGFNKDLVYLGKTRWGHKFRWKQNTFTPDTGELSARIDDIKLTVWLPLDNLEESFGRLIHDRKIKSQRWVTEDHGGWQSTTVHVPGQGVKQGAAWIPNNQNVLRDYWAEQRAYDSGPYAKLHEDTKAEIHNVEKTLRHALAPYSTAVKPSVTNG